MDITKDLTLAPVQLVQTGLVLPDRQTDKPRRYKSSPTNVHEEESPLKLMRESIHKILSGFPEGFSLYVALQNLYQNRLLGLAAMASPTRSSQTRQRCKDRHSYSPETYAVSGLNQDAFMLGLPRSTSDTDLVSPDSRSTLTISSSHYTIGQSEDLVITWDIKEDVDAGDWIGMYLVGESGNKSLI